MDNVYQILPEGAAETALLVVNTITALTVLWTVLCTLNFMSAQSFWLTRVAYVLIGVGAGAMLIGPMYWNHEPTVGAVALLTGVTVALVTERLYKRKLADRYASKLGVKNRRWYS